MKLFNNELDVGMKAIIIGTRLPENSHLIGRVVTVEAILGPGEGDKRFLREGQIMKVASGRIIAMCSGAGGHEQSRKRYIDNHLALDTKNLMPLPPLEELEQQKEQGLNLCH